MLLLLRLIHLSYFMRRKKKKKDEWTEKPQSKWKTFPTQNRCKGKRKMRSYPFLSYLPSILSVSLSCSGHTFLTLPGQSSLKAESFKYHTFARVPAFTSQYSPKNSNGSWAQKSPEKEEAEDHVPGQEHTWVGHCIGGAFSPGHSPGSSDEDTTPALRWNVCIYIYHIHKWNYETNKWEVWWLV